MFGCVGTGEGVVYFSFKIGPPGIVRSRYRCQIKRCSTASFIKIPLYVTDALEATTDQ